MSLTIKINNHEKKKELNTNLKPGFFEKFAFGMGDFWTSIVYTAMATYLTMFYTDVVGIAAAQVAIILLAVRFIVAIWDIIVGIGVDRTNTKFGKARPWMAIGGIFFGISFIFLFIHPFENIQASFIYAFISYLIVNIFYSAVNISYGSMNSLMTSDGNERITLNVYRMTTANIGAIILYIIAMPIINSFPTGVATGWTLLFGAVGLLIPFGYLFTAKFTKERVKPFVENSNNKVSIKRQFNALIRNKYWWLTTVMSLVNWIYNGVANGMNAYVAKYVLNDSNLLGIIGIATVLPMIIGLPLSNKIIQKFGKRNTAIIGLGLVIPGSLLMLINTQSSTVILISVIIRTIGTIPLNAVMNPMLTDVIDYGEWRFGVRTDGLVFSASSFGMKIGMGLSSSMVAVILAISNYDGLKAVQSTETIQAIIYSFIWAPIGVIAVLIILLIFYNLDKLQPKIIAELAECREN